MRLSALAFAVTAILCLAVTGCGRKGDLDPPPKKERTSEQTLPR